MHIPILFLSFLFLNQAQTFFSFSRMCTGLDGDSYDLHDEASSSNVERTATANVIWNADGLFHYLTIGINYS